MNTHAVIRVLLSGVLAVALSSCASYPVSKDLRAKAKPITPSQIAINPGGYVGGTVIWGGKILRVVNNTNGASIYALRVRLTGCGRPERDEAAGGRFIAQYNTFLDPEVFKHGRFITVAGEVTGVTTEPLQNTHYTYPVIAIKEIHLWHVERRNYSPWYWQNNWYGPGWGLGWYGDSIGPDEDWAWDWNEHPGYFERSDAR